MSTGPRLTIGLPICNGESLLPEAVEALLGQSYKDFELIISDNASTDRTAEICRSYRSRTPEPAFRTQPVLYLLRRLSGLVLAARDAGRGARPSDEPTAMQIPDIQINALVPGKERKNL